MKHILFQLITGFTIGQLCSFKGEIFKIVDFTMLTIFTNKKGSIVKATWKRPLWFCVKIRRRNGSIEIVGHRILKSIYEDNIDYQEIDSALRTL